MTPWQKRTIGVIIVSVVVIGGYDVFVEIVAGNSASISVLMTWASRKWPAIAFVWGFLMGHWFGQNATPVIVGKIREFRRLR